MSAAIDKIMDKLEARDERNGITRKQKLARTAAGLLLVGGGAAAAVVVENALSAPTHVEQLDKEFEHAEKLAEEHPGEIIPGTYVTTVVSEGETPTSIANDLSAPGMHQEVMDEVTAQQDQNGNLQQGTILLKQQAVDMTDKQNLQQVTPFPGE